MYHLTHSLSSSLPSAPGVSRIRSVDVKGESQAHHSPYGLVVYAAVRSDRRGDDDASKRLYGGLLLERSLPDPYLA